jgi:hypothetical protein
MRFDLLVCSRDEHAKRFFVFDKYKTQGNWDCPVFYGASGEN